MKKRQKYAVSFFKLIEYMGNFNKNRRINRCVVVIMRSTALQTCGALTLAWRVAGVAGYGVSRT